MGLVLAASVVVNRLDLWALNRVTSESVSIDVWVRCFGGVFKFHTFISLNLFDD